MKTEVMGVKTADAEKKWDLAVEVPEDLDEAKEVYGDAAYELFMSGLRVKIQNAGREVMRKGGTQEEAEKVANEYKPGGGRVSMKAQAMNMIVENAEDLRDDAKLHANVMAAFKGNKFEEVVNLIKEATGA